MMFSNIVAMLDQPSIDDRQRAIVDWADGERFIAFGDLKRLARSRAGLLAALGIGPGSRVLFAVRPKIELYILMLACWRLGAQAVFIDPSYSLEQIKHCLHLSKPDAVILDRDSDNFVCRQAFRYLGIKKLLSVKKLFAAETVPDTPALDTYGNGDALITFTSGSTGMPKGICRSHKFLQIQSALLKDELSIGHYKTELTTLPIFVLANLAAGVTSYLPPQPADRTSAAAELLVDSILRTMPERLLAAPAFLERLADELTRRGLALNFVREIRTGGAPVFPSLIRRLNQAFPQARIWTVYGSTEAEPICRLEISQNFSSAPDCILDWQFRNQAQRGAGLLQGRPCKAVELAIVNSDFLISSVFSAEQFALARCQAMAIGEILVAGEHVIPGYIGGLGDQETKVQVDNRTYHRTGDAGYLDREGNLYLVGRAAAVVEGEAGKVYPLVLEAAAMARGEFVRAAYLEVRGKRVLVVESGQESRPDLDLCLKRINELGLSERLVDKVIEHQIPVDKRHQSKVLYDKLRAML
jgi:acyl-CoA synthetase (AMP-forming)/AMP-acid ligase II